MREFLPGGGWLGDYTQGTQLLSHHGIPGS